MFSVPRPSSDPLCAATHAASGALPAVWTPRGFVLGVGYSFGRIAIDVAFEGGAFNPGDEEGAALAVTPSVRIAIAGVWNNAGRLQAEVGYVRQALGALDFGPGTEVYARLTDMGLTDGTEAEDVTTIGNGVRIGGGAHYQHSKHFAFSAMASLLAIE